MNDLRLSSQDFFDWRKALLKKGGRVVDLDWLLDIGGGISWSQLQLLSLDAFSSIELNASKDQIEAIWEIHLEHHTPLQHLLGRCPWRDFELEVSSDALIPRQESELLVDFAQELVGEQDEGTWADLGTGSGALSVALARSLPGWIGHAVDCSTRALSLAKKNLQRLAPNENVHLHIGSWWQPIEPWWGAIDLVLANPPYIPDDLVKDLDPVVRDHEPHLALCGGSDGLSSSKLVISGAMEGLAVGGWLILEHHFDQSESVMEIMHQNGLEEVTYKNDLQGISRFAIARRP